MKLAQFQRYLKDQGLDLAVFLHPDITITYFTQFKASYALLLVQPQAASLYLTGLDAWPKLNGITVQRLQKDWDSTLHDATVTQIGINKESLTVADYEKLTHLYPHAKFIDVGDEIKRLRSQKTQREIVLIQKASAIADQSFQSLMQHFSLKRFPTEISLAIFLQQQFQELGGDCAFPTIAACAANGAVPHHQTSVQKLKSGFLVLDFGASFKNYCTDMSRTIYLGKPSVAERKLYECVRNAQQQAIDAVEEGKLFSDLDIVARKGLGRYAPNFIHSLGHGIGLEVHEAPVFAASMQQKIAHYQVFTIEPGIYFHGKCGVRIEDTLVFKKKPIVLTRSSKELQILSNRP